jgi:hypothetical protein
MKAASVLFLVSLSSSAFGYYAFDSHATGMHTLQGQGVWQDRDGAKGSYLVQMQVEHQSLDRALVLTTYLVQNKTYTLASTLVKNQQNASYFDVIVEGEKSGDGYCVALPSAGVGALACHLECNHGETKFEGSLVIEKNKIERISSMVLPSGKKLVLKDTLNVAVGSSNFGLEMGAPAKGGKEPIKASKEPVKASKEPIAAPKGGKVPAQVQQAQEPIDQQPMDQQPVDQKPMDQQPMDQQPMDQQPVDQKPMDQQAQVQKPLDQTQLGDGGAAVSNDDGELRRDTLDPFAGELRSRPMRREDGGAMQGQGIQQASTASDAGEQDDDDNGDDAAAAAAASQNLQQSQGPVAQAPVKGGKDQGGKAAPAQAPVQQGGKDQGGKAAPAQAPVQQGGKDQGGKAAPVQQGGKAANVAADGQSDATERRAPHSYSDDYREQIRRQILAQQEYLRRNGR